MAGRGPQPPNPTRPAQVLLWSCAEDGLTPRHVHSPFFILSYVHPTGLAVP